MTNSILSNAIANNTETTWNNFSAVCEDSYTLSIGIPKDRSGSLSNDELKAAIEKSIKAGNFTIKPKELERKVCGGMKTIEIPSSQRAWYAFTLTLSNEVPITVKIHKDQVVDDMTPQEVCDTLEAMFKAKTFVITDSGRKAPKASF